MIRRYPRRCAALIVAYAIALQAVLTAFAPVTPARAGFVICRTADEGAPARHPPHEDCGACLAGHCGVAAGPDRDAVATAWPVAGERVETSVRIATPLLATPRRPHSPRAPPLA